MTPEEQEAITLTEFNKRLDAANTQRQQELDQREAEQARVELLLTQYERALDAIEVEQAAQNALPSYTALLRTRLQELANKTAEVAASL